MDRKIKLVFWVAMIFVFGQIAILQLGNFYFGFNRSHILVVILIWASAILCGWYSHWSLIYIQKNKKTLYLKEE